MPAAVSQPGVALLVRDRGGPALLGQMLVSPMLDDRNDTVSAHQIDGVGVWDRSSNDTGWNALLGDRRGTDAVSVYAAPARATDLAGLPPAFVECGSAEVFRDEDVAYASGLWAAGEPGRAARVAGWVPRLRPAGAERPAVEGHDGRPRRLDGAPPRLVTRC